MFQQIIMSFGVITSITAVICLIWYIITINVNKQINRPYLREIIIDTGSLIALISWVFSILEILAIRC